MYPGVIDLKLGIGQSLSPQKEPCACKLQDLEKAEKREQERGGAVQEGKLVAFERPTMPQSQYLLVYMSHSINPTQQGSYYLLHFIDEKN